MPMCICVMVDFKLHMNPFFSVYFILKLIEWMCIGWTPTPIQLRLKIKLNWSRWIIWFSLFQLIYNATTTSTITKRWQTTIQWMTRRKSRTSLNNINELKKWRSIDFEQFLFHWNNQENTNKRIFVLSINFFSIIKWRIQPAFVLMHIAHTHTIWFCWSQSTIY